MIIVAGHLILPAEQRAEFLTDALAVIAAARAAPGCLDYHLSPDPIDPARINIFEQWATAADVEAFRGNGPSSEQQQVIVSADVHQHTIASTVRL